MAKNTVVYLQDSNDFKNINQTIKGAQILAANYGAHPPEGFQPERAGEVYFEIGDGTTEHAELVAWVSVAQNGGFEWVKLAGGSSEDAALIHAENNFQEHRQKIKDNQIISFINGGSQTPEQSGRPPQFNGQFYISFKRLSNGNPDVAMWVGTEVGTGSPSWLPVMNGAIDLSKVAKLDMSNVFENPTQFLGDADKGRLAVGFRYKTTDETPAFDTNWSAEIDGEEVLQINGDRRILWKALNVQESGKADWRRIWDSHGGNLPENVALTDKTNLFTWRQKIQISEDPNGPAHITSARKSAFDPTASHDHDFIPYAMGDVVVREYLNGDGNTAHQVYMAMHESDEYSWEKIYDSDLSTTGLESRITTIELGDEAQDTKINAIELRLDDVETGLEATSGDLVELDELVQLEADKLVGLQSTVQDNSSRIASLETGSGCTDYSQDITNLQSRMTEAETDIAALKAGVSPDDPDFSGIQSQIDALGGRMTTAESDIDTNAGSILSAHNKIEEHNTKLVDHNTRLTNQGSQIQQNIQNITAVNTRVDNLTETVSVHSSTITKQTNDIETNTLNMTQAGKDIVDIKAQNTGFNSSIDKLNSDLAETTQMSLNHGLEIDSVSARVTALENKPYTHEDYVSRVEYNALLARLEAIESKF